MKCLIPLKGRKVPNQQVGDLSAPHTIFSFSHFTIAADINLV